MKIIYERLLTEVLEARLERLGWIAARWSSSAAKKPSILVDTLNAKDRRQKLLLNTYYLPPRAPHLYMSLVDNAATVKSQTHPWTHLLVSLLGHSY